MDRTELQALIDRVIGKKGILRVPSYWVSRLLGNLMDYTDGKAKEGKAYTRQYVDDNQLPMMRNVTYAELLSLRADRQLVAGQQYRITDYETLIDKDGCRSIGRVYDIVVTALSERYLAPEAYAVISARANSYQGSDIDSWELLYSLDNDYRYPSASANGKGVVYHMKDAKGNEAPYDFKNVQFLRRYKDGVLDENGEEEAYFFTFSGYEGYGGYDGSQIVDLTTAITNDTEGQDHIILNSGIVGYGSWNNVILKQYRANTGSDPLYVTGMDYRIGSNCNGNTVSLEEVSGSVTLGSSCRNNTISQASGKISIGNRCCDNTLRVVGDVDLGELCVNNVIINGRVSAYEGNVIMGDECYNITHDAPYASGSVVLGPKCHDCVVNGEVELGYCCWNIEVDDGSRLTAGDYCSEVYIRNYGDHYSKATIGNWGQNITTSYGELICGDDCGGITVGFRARLVCGHSCSGINCRSFFTLGNNCSNLTLARNGQSGVENASEGSYIGHSCKNMDLTDCNRCTIGNNCSGITVTDERTLYNLQVMDNVSNIRLTGAKSTAGLVTIEPSVRGSSGTPYVISLDVNRPTTYFIDTAGNLRSYSTEDLLGGTL